MGWGCGERDGNGLKREKAEVAAEMMTQYGLGLCLA